MNLSDMELIMTVSRTKSMRKAAKLVHLSQSAISKKIQLIEDEYGITLFHRTAAGVELTADGQLFIQYAGSALHTLRTGIEQTRMKNAERKVTRLGVASPLISELHRFSGYFQSHGGPLEIVTSNSPEIVRKLQEGTLDFGLFGYESIPGDISAIPLYRQDFHLYASDRYLPAFLPFADRTVSYVRASFIQALRELPLILPKQGIHVRQMIDRIMEKEFGGEPLIAVETDTLELMEQLAEREFGCTFITQSVYEPSTGRSPADFSGETFRIEALGRGMFRIPLPFLFPSRQVFFAQSPHRSDGLDGIAGRTSGWPEPPLGPGSPEAE
ncbi:LysR family transcriptional regulator [Paenibacillus sp. 7124]|uniref:LysR family transcriptional regulator n=1 Tax=Paenibacillus apii TaxID=1850370 RepID=A0A6M1PNX8_9BACL|nr:LysR family transcriptional regulator [Paenibacillus apii]NGM83922.1 LysR family transcriptional regulator [Paenibacillus apii]NJJ40560.1 LysR family transcriptional regulator [Paenibacillus apii]